MDITLYLDPLYEFLSLPPNMILERLLILYAWIPFAFIFMWMLWVWRANELEGQWGSKQKFVLLAIDIPKGNEQSPKAVENFFTYLAGAHSNLNLIDRFVDGKFQLIFSCEIVSIGGYTQFIIHSPSDYRHLVEAGIYSQYPDAEIMEIQDYTTGFPTNFPNDEYDVWGADFIPTAKTDMLPIKTYKDFEHNYGKPETHFRDPMSTLMDLCSSLRPGENLWYQILVKPTSTDWTKKGPVEINKILGVKTQPKPSVFFKIADGFADMLSYLTGLSFNIKVEEKKSESKKMLDLTPDEKKKVEGIQEKMSKLGFECKLRFVYMSRKDVMNKPKVVNGFVGFIKQFGFNDLNALKPDNSVTGTSTAYFMKAYRINIRKNRIVRAYIGRSQWRGRLSYILNVEELATLWHFPIEHVVKAPLIQKTPGRKAEPPTTLPLADDVTSTPEMLDAIFVSEQPSGPVQKSYKEENIFDMSLDEDELGGEHGQETHEVAAASSDPFADIFVEPGNSQSDEKPGHQGQPPANLPFA